MLTDADKKRIRENGFTVPNLNPVRLFGIRDLNPMVSQYFKANKIEIREEDKDFSVLEAYVEKVDPLFWTIQVDICHPSDNVRIYVVRVMVAYRNSSPQMWNLNMGSFMAACHHQTVHILTINAINELGRQMSWVPTDILEEISGYMTESGVGLQHKGIKLTLAPGQTFKSLLLHH